MVVALLVTGISTLALLVVGVLHWLTARNVEAALAEVAGDALPELPEGHRPPPGLAPISGRERDLAHEVERGLKDLQAFLQDA